MFQFSWYPLACARAWVLPRRVVPLGYPRLGLLDSSPGLIAVLPRPSSAANAKASALCPFLFDLHQVEHKTYSLFKVQSGLVHTKPHKYTVTMTLGQSGMRVYTNHVKLKYIIMAGGCQTKQAVRTSVKVRLLFKNFGAVLLHVVTAALALSVWAVLQGRPKQAWGEILRCAQSDRGWLRITGGTQNDCGKVVNKLLPLTRKAMSKSKAMA